MKFLLGYLSANPTEYSPLPQPNSSTKGLSFLKNSAFHFLLKETNHLQLLLSLVEKHLQMFHFP